MWYLYYILPDRRLVNVVDRNGNHLQQTTRDAAAELAYEPSFKYPVTLDRRGDLNNTRDGHPVQPD